MTAFPKYERYKDSGVEWLGKIPEHWESEKGKWLFRKMDRPVRQEDGVVTAFRDGQVTLRTNRRTDGFTNAIKEHGYQGIRKGDLVIHAMDAFAGAIGVSESDGKSTPVYAACVPRKENTVSPSFYAYLLRYMAHSGFIVTLAKGIRERSTDFRFNDFGALGLPLPPKPEQDRIVTFLDRKTAEIDALIAKKQRQIELLDEQKAILINRSNGSARSRRGGRCFGCDEFLMNP
jgi:type I restriction enzyme S subunit